MWAQKAKVPLEAGSPWDLLAAWLASLTLRSQLFPRHLAEPFPNCVGAVQLLLVSFVTSAVWVTLLANLSKSTLDFCVWRISLH